MMETSTCRLCLKTSKRMKSLNDFNNKVPYWLMIKSISDIKLSGTNEIACVSCCRRLVEAYNFKLLIESSDATLRNANISNNTKRIIFNNIEDIKVEIEIFDDKAIQENAIDIKHDVDQFNYHDTLIKRVPEADRKPLSAVELLNSFKEESEDEGFAFDMYDNVNYDPDYTNSNLNDTDNEDQKPLIKTKVNDYPDCDDEDEKLLKSLSQRRTRNKVYEIKPRVTRSAKKLRDDDENDEDYTPPVSVMTKAQRERALLKLKKLRNIQPTNKRPKGRPSQAKVLAEPMKPQVMDNIRLSHTRERIPKEKIDICYHCGKQCKNLKKHLLMHSNIERKFKCDKCPKAYRSAKTLNNHKLVHEPRTVKCDYCVATFHSKYHYHSHLRHHIVEKNFVCEICSKAFKLPYHLRKHKAHMHNIGVKEYKCDRCERVCKTRDLLRHHLRVHTRERPYNCELCSQPYSYKHDFNRHCLNKHGVQFKMRSVYVLNEEVLVKERALMRDLMLKMQKGNLPENPFDGPQGYLAYQHMMKYLATQQLPVDLQL